MGNEKSSNKVPKRSKHASLSNGLNENEYRLLELTTGFSREEIDIWHRGFMNTYPNGIDLPGFIKNYQETFTKGNAKRYAKFAFKAFDRNRNGTISFDEYLMATAVGLFKNDKSKGFELAFNIYDIDKNGMISRQEMSQVISAMYDMVGHGEYAGLLKVNQIFEKFDVDKNDNLDKREFINFITTDPVCKEVFEWLE